MIRLKNDQLEKTISPVLIYFDASAIIRSQSLEELFEECYSDGVELAMQDFDFYGAVLDLKN